MSENNKKTMSKDEKLAVIESLIANNDCLNPHLFDKNNLIFPSAREYLLELADFVAKKYFQGFVQFKIRDVILCGSLSSHIYNDKSDMDLLIVVDAPVSKDVAFNEIVFNSLNIALGQEKIFPLFHNHPIDFFVLQEYSVSNLFNCYSVLADKWITPSPVHQEFEFTAEELYKEFAKYNAEFHRFVTSLEKTELGLLTFESQKALAERLNKIKEDAYKAKCHSEKHEYSLEYTLYRLLKKFGMYAHFTNYIFDSQKGHMNPKEK